MSIAGEQRRGKGQVADSVWGLWNRLRRKVVDVSFIDCLYFPGGYGPDILRLHAGTLELVRECDRQGKFIASICHGPWVLISAGIMKGRKATCYVAVKDDLENAGAEFVDVPAIRDGNLITGRVPDDLPELCQEITKALSE